MVALTLLFSSPKFLLIILRFTVKRVFLPCNNFRQCLIMMMICLCLCKQRDIIASQLTAVLIGAERFAFLRVRALDIVEVFAAPHFA